MYVFIHLHLLCYLARLNFTNSFPYESGYMKIIPRLVEAWQGGFQLV